MQLACAGCAVLDAVLTVIVSAVGFEKAGPIEEQLEFPANQIYGVLVPIVFAAAYLVAGFFALKGRTWSFWLALVVFGVTAAGVVLVPLRGAESGVLNPTGITLALVNDGAAALLVLWMLLGIVRYRRPWAFRRAADRE